jgi:ABC-type transport system involved in cytochrome bd biosynthesis fused ATPase/permease subunit
MRQKERQGEEGAGTDLLSLWRGNQRGTNQATKMLHREVEQVQIKYLKGFLSVVYSMMFAGNVDVCLVCLARIAPLGLLH